MWFGRVPPWVRHYRYLTYSSTGTIPCLLVPSSYRTGTRVGGVPYLYAPYDAPLQHESGSSSFPSLLFLQFPTVCTSTVRYGAHPPTQLSERWYNPSQPRTHTRPYRNCRHLLLFPPIAISFLHLGYGLRYRCSTAPHRTAQLHNCTLRRRYKMARYHR